MNASAPIVVMDYLGVDSLNNTANNTVASWFHDFNATLLSYGSPDEYFLVPQIGLALPHDGKESKIADGSYDQALRALTFGLAALQRPIFLRIGYEFNGPWNGYKPDSYKGAFQRIVQFLRTDPFLNKSLATVWDRTCDELNNAQDWYPGDEYVDWYGVNIYSDHSAPGDTGCVAPFIKSAKDKGFPVALGEVAPRGLYCNKSDTWGKWFEPYFHLFDEGSPVKLTSYIDRDWEKNPSYKGWGDSRVQGTALASNYTAKMSGKNWLNKANQTVVEQILGLA